MLTRRTGKGVWMIRSVSLVSSNCNGHRRFRIFLPPGQLLFERPFCRAAESDLNTFSPTLPDPGYPGCQSSIWNTSGQFIPHHSFSLGQSAYNVVKVKTGLFRHSGPHKIPLVCDCGGYVASCTSPRDTLRHVGPLAQEETWRTLENNTWCMNAMN